MKTLWIRAVVAASLVLAAAGVAVAAPELRFETKAGEPTPQNAKPPPTITVTVIGGSALASDAYVLRQTDSTLPGVKASKVERYLEAGEPVGIAVLVYGDATWLGGRKDLIGGLESALGAIAAAGPPGSQGLVLMYGAAVEVRKPAGPLAELSSVKLAPKDAAVSPAPRDLAGGVRAAIAELDKLSTPRKALFIIGDGLDGEGSKTPSGPMRDLARQLEEKKIIAYAAALHVDEPALGAPVPPVLKVNPNTGEDIPDPAAEDAYAAANADWRRIKEQAIDDLKILVAGHAQKLTSPGNLDGAVSSFASLLDDRYYVTFVGFDTRLKAGFTWDGKEHPLMLRIDGQDTEVKQVALTPAWGLGGKGSSWWIWLLVAGGAVAVGGVVVAMRKKPQVAPPPGVPMPGVPGAPPGPPGPPGATAAGVIGAPPGPPQRQKTMFVGGGDEAVFPQVAWMVFMTGPKRLKFVKLHPGSNKIGTGSNCEVVVDDGFMSTEHTLILMMPDGYWVQDNGSTNGTFVNDHKLTTKQELYDNDLILVGKTVLKFKSVS